VLQLGQDPVCDGKYAASTLETQRLMPAPQPSFEESFADRRAQLARMRSIATLLLLAVLALLAVSAYWAQDYPALIWLRSFAEAATAGAIADWFAVVALFRRPLGLPVPHTAIIPRNKDRIGRSLGQFVERNFLTPENIVRRLAQAGFARRFAAWLSQPANAEKAAGHVCEAIPPLLSALEDEDMRRLIERSVTPMLERVDAAHLAARILGLFTAEQRHQKLLDAALRATERWVVGNRELLVEKFGEISRYTPQFIDRYIVDRLVAGLIDVLHQVAADPAHELRTKFDAAAAQFTHDLQHSPKYREQAELLKQDVLGHLKSQQYYRSLWRAGREQIARDLSREQSVIRAHLAQALLAFGAGLSKDEPLQRKMDGWLERAVKTVAVRNRHEISLLIEEIVRGWDARDMAEKAELQIGSDLQYIRINGMVVGGLVGLVLHALSRLF
jgi:uncharacterized membrane-anchored protein YjiN (DUF445 family)